jgi:ribonuclease BN (tRNA processing enzyme)
MASVGDLRASRGPGASRLILLGTGGGAYPKTTRCGSANAVVVGDTAYLIDCGEGVHRQLWRAGLTVSDRLAPDRPLVRALFITHLHADHIMDLANLVQGSWPAHVIDVFGPGPAGSPIPTFRGAADRPRAIPEELALGLRGTVDHLLRAFAYNVKLRVADEGRNDVTDSLRVHEIGVRRDGYAPDIDLGVVADASSAATAAPPMDPVAIYPEDDRGVRVTATLVQHAPVFPAFGFRFDTPHGSIAFSGDTGPCDNVVRLAEGADILVHEVIDVDRLFERLSRLPNSDAVRNHLSAAHSSPEQVGAVATRAGVRRLVLSHLVPGDGDPTDEEWVARVRPHFDGEIVCGADLDELPLTGVRTG